MNSNKHQASPRNLISLPVEQPIALVQAEEYFLATLLMSPEIAVCFQGLLPEAFYSETYREVWHTMLHMIAEGRRTDIVGTTASLMDRGMEPQKASEVISHLLDMPVYPDAEGARAYSDMIRDRYKRRQLDNLRHVLGALARDDRNLDWEREAQEQFSAIFQELAVGEKLQVEVADFLYSDRPKFEYISTGIKYLDAHWNGGLRVGEVATIGARPAMGKTTVMCWLALRCAMHGKSVAIVSTETTKEDLLDRLLGLASDSPWSEIPYVHPDKLNQARELVAPFANLISVDDISSKPSQILAGLRTRALESNIGLIMVDHVHEIFYSKEMAGELDEFMSSLRRLNRDIGASTVLMAQLNRGVESRENKRPTMSDFREFGCLEQKSDKMIGLYRDEVYNPDTPDRGVFEFLTLKNRRGRVGPVKCLVDIAVGKFADMEPNYNEF